MHMSRLHNLLLNQDKQQKACRFAAGVARLLARR
jgi:hypothetical protein